ncbi:MAG: PRC-barrel domain-containing protein [Candidatus Eisenbacteria bacterium]|uniref:PRC-barrel domain-containing protein n=1 Tax=Eiseniibacteriota bacterium TaxID=2212470 RepID=A0A956SED9_UNCEI|nr:PRC-barrel domain-containing protein [Candidatus Eisenbacteria bacterium]
MYLRAKHLQGTKIHATDGKLGQLHSVYFEDRDWKVRYFLVDTGGHMGGRLVLISPYAMDSVNSRRGEIRLDLTTAQVETSPPMDAALPVSRQMEARMVQHYGWPAYWSSYPTAAGLPIPPAEAGRPTNTETVPPSAAEDSGLRSSDEIIGYGIHARDGEIGYVEDIFCETMNWHVRFLLVDTRRFLPGGRNVILPVGIINGLSWQDGTVDVASWRKEIKEAPQLPDDGHIDTSVLSSVRDHYEAVRRL